MAVIIDKCADSKSLATLKSLNIKYYKTDSLDFLYAPVNTHPDMQIHFIDYHTAVVAPSVYEHYVKTLPSNITVLKGEKDPGRTYPEDCAYNVAKLGKRVIGNLFYVDSVIKNLYTAKGFEFINVKQGYTKCNLCIVDDNSVITEDEGLFKSLTNHGIDVLKIPHGEVKLKFFDNGFIGGAAGKIASDKIAFYGDVSKTTYFEQIESFLSSRGVKMISLSQSTLNDFGSILYFNG